MKNIVAIIGRPNVGKSTLFNRLAGHKKAITDDRPGVTRDRNYDVSEWCGHTFTIVDTGGYLTKGEDHFDELIGKHIAIAIEEAHLILFMVDCQAGLMAEDELLAAQLRKSGKPLLVVANKADNVTLAYDGHLFHKLGLGTIHMISASHGTGTGDLLDAVVAKLPAVEDEEEATTRLPQIAFIGRPNVGKSTFVNALLKQDRSIVSAQPHTTRDATDSYYNLYGKRFIITDTAGIYRKKYSKEAIEFYSMIRSVKAIHRADVCIMMLDAQEGLTTQDLHIMHLIRKHKKGMVVLVNKCDLFDPNTFDPHQYRQALIKELGTMSDTPILFTSSLQKKRIFQAVEHGLAVYERCHMKITTAELNKVILNAVERTPPPMTKGKLITIKYAVQLSASSPTFALFANLPQYISAQYKRYLIGQIRQCFNLDGAPITLVFKSKQRVISR